MRATPDRGTKNLIARVRDADAILSGFSDVREVRSLLHNLTTAPLVEAILQREEAQLAANGVVSAVTGEFTGRTPENRFIVEDFETAHRVHWGEVNQPISPDVFERVRRRMAEWMQGRDVFVQDCFAGAHPAHRLKLRVMTGYAWHALFARQLFLRPSFEQLQGFQPDFTLACLPECFADPAQDGTRSGTCVLLNFSRRLVLIAGTGYAGEIKKSIFSVLNFLLPQNQVLPMHCSANIGRDGDAALFFGLSGTGKTTLSADPSRRLIGDDEHGWGTDGVFNFEGGCYAKCIHLSENSEPQIWNALRFGVVLENVKLDPLTRVPDFNDDSITENTRAAYPIEFIPNAVTSGCGPHPRNVILLTADAFGVLPPISQLGLSQALYHFLSGYTAKLAGTETGVDEPQATFSTCFGEPFLPLDPLLYARMLGQRLAEHNVRCWLINTGWTGGRYGVGSRIRLEYTRRMVHAALTGELEQVGYVEDPVFGLSRPVTVPGVPEKVLDPRRTWPDPSAWDRAAHNLAERFQRNFEKFTGASREIRSAGPRAA